MRTRCLHMLVQAVAALLLHCVAHAHSFDPGLLDLREREAGSFEVRWKAPPGAGEALAPQFPAPCREIGVRLESNTRFEGSAFWRIDCGTRALSGESITFAGLAENPTDVLVRVEWANGRTASGLVNRVTPRFSVPSGVPLGDRGAMQIVRAYVRLGIEHILLGFDHLLFVTCLIFLVSSWRSLVQTITAFTVAHSITLATAAVGWVTIDQAPLEACIALSIVFLAAEIARKDADVTTLSRRKPWLIALAFGLLHGFGFASALANVGIPSNQTIAALLSFNVGVELGQLLFVMLATIPILLFQSVASQSPIGRMIPVYAIGSLAAYWTFTRLSAL